MIRLLTRRFHIPPERIRSFCIVAHIDHGKSTLADRLLEKAGFKVDKAQMLDTLQVERERGITVRAQTVSMNYTYNGTDYLINLIDTPGHVDFSYEVSRSLRACKGAILLVDATSGIQAQTFSTFYSALEADLTIIPAVNKVDHPAAIPSVVSEQIETHFDLQDAYRVSARTGLNVEKLLEAVILKVPPEENNTHLPFRGFLFDSWFDKHRGVICIVKVVDGEIRKGDLIKSVATEKQYSIVELGELRINLKPTEMLTTGQVGYFVLNMRQTSEALIGDTFCKVENMTAVQFPGFKQPKPMVYAGVFPTDPDDYIDLQRSLDKYLLEDRSIFVTKDTSSALGSGFRIGFLGLLHMDIFRERLEQEYNQDIIITAPSVPYKVELKDDTQVIVNNANELPDLYQVKEYFEPRVNVTIILPNEYMGQTINYCMSLRGVQKSMTVIDEARTMLIFDMPLSELIVGFFDTMKSMTKGMATVDYEYRAYEPAMLGVMTVLLNGTKVDALSMIVHKSQAYDRGRSLVKKLKEHLPNQLFEVAIQAAYNNKVVARETMKALRKNVTAKCYGGDISRKRKLLEKQKEGKKKMRMFGNVQVDSNTFQQVLKID
jgi:elongation factor 4